MNEADGVRDKILESMTENNEIRDETIRRLLANQEKVVTALEKSCQQIKVMVKGVTNLEKRTRNTEKCLQSLLEILTMKGILVKWQIDKN